MYWAYLIHLGFKMWPYWRPEFWEKKKIGKPYSDPRMNDPNVLLFDKSVWDETIGFLQKSGGNMLVIDIGEGMRFDSHPELAVEGSWSKNALRDEVKKLRDMGITPVPKLNFSTMHDDWLGVYERMVSTPVYYQVVSDVIAETAEVFGNTGYFHIGMDEEKYYAKYDSFFQVQRGLDFWWNDINFMMGKVRAAGCVPMMWADTFWYHKEESLENISKDAILCNWYYKDFTDTATETSKVRFNTYTVLADNGFFQMPTGSNWERTDNMCETIKHCKSGVPHGKWFGFMQTSWVPTIHEEIEVHKEAVSLLGSAREEWESTEISCAGAL